MSIRTPLPYSFATNRGTASKLKFHAIDAPMHSASSNKPDLPRDTVCISRSENRITYRIQWSNYTYTQIEVLTHPHEYVWLTGGSPTITLHEKVMDTIKSLHPMVMQLFSS